MGKIFCTKCGAKLDDSVKYCPYCGLATPEEKIVNFVSSDNHNAKYCSKCGYELEYNDLFCSECGAKCDNNINEIQNNKSFNNFKYNDINRTENNDSLNFIKILFIGFVGAITSIIIGFLFASLLNHFGGFLISVVITTAIIAASRHTNELELAFEGACTGFITALILFILFHDDFLTIIAMLFRIFVYTIVGAFVGGAEMMYGRDDD